MSQGIVQRIVDKLGELLRERLHVAVFDHTGNPNYPTYWHARDYGLFAVNPLGAHGFDPKTPTLNFTIDKGASATFHYRIFIISGTVTDADLNRLADAFNSK